MKKYAFLVYQPEYSDFLKNLQKLGVLHVIEKEQELGEEIRGKYKLLKKFDETLKFLKSRGVETQVEKHDKEGLTIIQEVAELLSKKDRLIQQKVAALKEASQVEPWGEFSSSTIEKLENKGIYIKYYTCPSKKFNPEWAEKYDIQEVNTAKGLLFFIVVSKTREVNIEAEEFPVFQKSFTQLYQEAEKVDENIASLEKQLDQYAICYIKELETSRAYIEHNTDFERAISNTGSEAENKIMVLEGWVPVTRTEELDKYLNSKSLVYLSSDPEEHDNVPILLKNNRFSRLFEPIGRMFMFPVYKELDLVPLFAPFFMLFFGFCFGDAGYGLLILLGVTLFKFKAKKALKPLLSLVQILSLSAVLFGAVSGTFFGISLIDSGYTLTEQSFLELKTTNAIPATVTDSLVKIKDFTIQSRGDFEAKVEKVIGTEQYNIYRDDILKSATTNFRIVKNFRHKMLDSQSMFQLALILGAIQILFGMLIRVINTMKQKGFVYALPIIGWLILALSIITIQILQKKGIVTEPKVLYYIILCIWGILVFGFSNPKNIFLSIGAGIGDVYFTVTGFLGDLLSYIRLFALGLSSSILGFVFNSLASQMLEGGIPVVSHLFFVILLLFGHSINIFLSALGSFVHPMRLTFVEFYKNAGFTGGGKEYQPFEYKSNN